MSGMRQPLLATAERLFAQRADSDMLREAGFADVLRPERDGGFGGDWGDMFALLRLAGYLHPSSAIGSLALPAGGIAHDAFARVAMAAGALDRTLEMSVEHVNMRQQFGRTLAKFQAVQQSLAILSCEAAAVNAAGAAAAAALARGDAGLEIACAKLRTNQAIGVATALAHQAHGAIGFTAEHDLHHFTGALTRWRGEAGNDRYWSRRIGDMAAAMGADGLWPGLVDR